MEGLGVMCRSEDEKWRTLNAILFGSAYGARKNFYPAFLDRLIGVIILQFLIRFTTHC